MGATPEGKVKELVKELLKRQGAWYFLPVSLGLGAHGIPDFIGCYKGRTFGIETKAPGKKPTALQLRQKGLIETAGGAWFLVDGEDSLQRVQQWMEGFNES